MRFGFVYKITLHDRANPPHRADGVSELLRQWFSANGVKYGLGSLGGGKNVYGDVATAALQETEQVRGQLAVFCAALPVSATVRFGITRSDEWSIMETEWERAFEVNNLTELDRNAAHAYYAELAQWAQKHAKKPTTDEQ